MSALDGEPGSQGQEEPTSISPFYTRGNRLEGSKAVALPSGRGLGRTLKLSLQDLSSLEVHPRLLSSILGISHKEASQPLVFCREMECPDGHRKLQGDLAPWGPSGSFSSHPPLDSGPPQLCPAGAAGLPRLGPSLSSCFQPGGLGDQGPRMNS